ncbi:MAG TPA: hypothetical protein VG125_33900 [Pirellulales bacterium]|jgi:hypothetical protein|nr:hypothetical protein [Pirellulales bacterium]
MDGFTPAFFAAAIAAIASLSWAIYLKGHSNRVHVTDRLAEDYRTDRKHFEERIRQLELDAARSQSPLMKQVQDLLSAGLHHPDPKHSRQDYLLEKLDKTELTSQEIPELFALLDAQIADPDTATDERQAAKALRAIMPLVVKEKAAVDEVNLERKEGAL